mmetsp:Transcript_24417/g.68458  ORF Transcript_24417/g.68458 Transcript_24417/m.68458 type:complete len:273 (+) Transcript_24417:118-936(+)
MANDNVITFLHMSDTHNMLSNALLDALPAADVLLHTGDFTDIGKPDEYQKFNVCLGHAAASGKWPRRVVILGNHDVKQLSLPDRHADYERCAARLSNATHVPLHEVITIDAQEEGVSLHLYGAPWWAGHTWDYCPKITLRGGQRDGARFYDIPTDEHAVHVIASHGPHFGHRDEADGVTGNHSGSNDLKDVLAKCPWVGLHAHGHIHEDRGTSQSGTTLVVNSAMKNRWGKRKLQFLPHLITATATRDPLLNKVQWTFAAEEINVDLELGDF